MLLGMDRLVAQHQAREVHGKLVGGGKRADRIAELALIAEVHDLLVHTQREALEGISLAHDVVSGSGGMPGKVVITVDIHSDPVFFCDGALVRGVEAIDGIKEGGKRGAEVPAQPAAIADLKDPLFFSEKGSFIPVLWVTGPGNLAHEVSLKMK
jgi:hypothetical protein